MPASSTQPDGTISINTTSGWTPIITSNSLATQLAAGTVTTITAPKVQVTATAIVPTTDGLTTGIIPDNTSFLTVTSANSAHIVTLPTPTPGTVVRLLNNATGYNIRSSAPATVGINGGVGASVKSAIAASTYVELMCVSATAWIGRQYTTAGVQSATAVAS
jgi:hypothetical protein